MTPTPLSKSKGQRSTCRGREYCGGLPHSLLVLQSIEHKCFVTGNVIPADDRINTYLRSTSQWRKQGINPQSRGTNVVRPRPKSNTWFSKSRPRTAGHTRTRTWLLALSIYYGGIVSSIGRYFPDESQFQAAIHQRNVLMNLDDHLVSSPVSVMYFVCVESDRLWQHCKVVDHRKSQNGLGTRWFDDYVITKRCCCCCCTWVSK